MIVLATLNSRYSHSAFGLRYLKANLKQWQDATVLIEGTLQENVADFVQKILIAAKWREQGSSTTPCIVGLSVYIWNVQLMTQVAQVLKSVAPEIVVVLGGPEVTYETEQQAIFQYADHVICGEGEVAFYDLVCAYFLPESKGKAGFPKLIKAVLPELSALELPYAQYTSDDVLNRVIYVEASRGCPYKCEYCLSSLDTSVRAFPLEAFLKHMDTLIERGVRQFKFVDRTFNLSPTTSTRILQFFLDQIQNRKISLFLHFEMVPDRLPEVIKSLIEQFPNGSLQFEIGVQTLDPFVARQVSRRQDLLKLEQNLKYLRKNTTVHTHADLIVGLPGETFESFKKGFDYLFGLEPDEIQVGILKRLRGAPIIRHEAEFKLRFEASPPYSVLQTSTLDFFQIRSLTAFSKYWDLIANSGDFKSTLRYFWSATLPQSPFESFYALAVGLERKFPFRHHIALLSLVQGVYEVLTGAEWQTRGCDPEALRIALIEDYSILGKRDRPRFLEANRPHVNAEITQERSKKLNKRQVKRGL